MTTDMPTTLEHLRALAIASTDARHAFNTSVMRFNLALSEEMGRLRIPQGYLLDLNDGKVKPEQMCAPYPPVGGAP